MFYTDIYWVNFVTLTPCLIKMIAPIKMKYYKIVSILKFEFYGFVS